MIEPLPPAGEVEALLGPLQEVSGQGVVAATVVLARALRARGVGVGLNGLMDALHSVVLVGLDSPVDLRRVLSANLVASLDEEVLFDRLFDLYFLGRGDLGLADREGPRPKTQAILDSSAADREDGVDERVSAYSPVEVLLRRDLEGLVGREVERAAALLDERLAELLTRPSRRWTRQGRRGRIDFRRSFRRSLDQGGEIIKLIRQGPKTRRRRLILILDVSGSMDAHARFQLLFARSWIKHWPGEVEVFGFSTSLKRLTSPLTGASFSQALSEMSRLMPHWSGGTRIGASLKELLEGFGSLISSGAVAALFSDGWDRGEIPLLKRQMSLLRSKVKHIIWLNPLSGSPGYEPICAGMQAALPFVDQFLAARSLADLLAGGRALREAALK